MTIRQVRVADKLLPFSRTCPGSRKGLMRRLNHRMPFDLICSDEALGAALLGSLSSVAVLAGLFFYLNFHTRRDYFTIWGVAWLFYGLWLVLRITNPGHTFHGWGAVLGQWCIGTSAVFLLWGSFRFTGVAIPQRSMALFLAFIYTWALAAGQFAEGPRWTQLPVFILAGAASGFAAAGFYRMHRERKTVGASLLAIGFSLWGLYLASYPFAEANAVLRSAGVFLSSGLELFIGVGMIVLMLEEARASAERLEREIEAVQFKNESLQIKIISTEAKFRSLLGDNALEEDLQSAYERLRETQQRVVQQERLRALGQMASGIAHDINNSLTPIIGYSDFLLDSTDALPEESRKHLQCIRTAAADIAQVIEQVRQFYRRREESDALQAVDLNSIVREVVEMTRPRWKDIPQKDGVVLTIETEFQKDLPEIRENAGELREAVTNLVLNAIDAMPRGGAIKIVTRVTESTGAGLEPAGNCHVVLEVRDTGKGMDNFVKEHCLEPFFSTKGPRGSGLGLAMVYGMIRRHQGSIDVESEPGRGTTVRLVFNPVGSPVRFPVAPAVTADLPPLRILCIDDDQRIGAMLREVLASQHHLVEIADGGAKGVEAFRNAQRRGQPFQVVITDLGMPNVDGRQIVRTVKAESPGTPVIMLTGWAAMMDQEGELPKDVDAVISKPPSISRLHEALAHVTKAA